MKTIKLRAWDKKNGMTNSFCIQASSGFVSYKIYEWLSGDKKPVVMLYIGKNDKYGKEIYEGTILKDPQGNLGEVIYLAPSFAIRWKRKDGSWDTDTCFEYGTVIGNVYEHPRLMEAI